jgi:hypothetical protein
MNTLEILKAGRAKISLVENFTTGTYGRNPKGKSVKPEEACCWCSLGAIVAVSGVSYYRFPEVLAALEDSMDGDIPDFNDSHTHAEVLAAWDEAIEKEGAK